MWIFGIYMVIGFMEYPLMHFEQFPGAFFRHHCNVSVTNFTFPAKGSGGFELHGVHLDVPHGEDSSCLPRIPAIFYGGNIEAHGGAAHQVLQMLTQVMHVNPKLRFRVYISAYRGYPPNQGWTSERALRADGADLLDFVLNASGTKQALLLGASMGAGAASQLAAYRPEKIAGLLVTAPWSTLWYETIVVRVPISYVLIPHVWWVSELFDSVKAVGSLPPSMPVLVISPRADELIQPREHRWVFDASVADKKWWCPVPGASHVDVSKQANGSAQQIVDWVQASWPQPLKMGNAEACPLLVNEPIHCWSDPSWSI